MSSWGMHVTTISVHDPVLIPGQTRTPTSFRCRGCFLTCPNLEPRQIPLFLFIVPCSFHISTKYTKRSFTVSLATRLEDRRRRKARQGPTRPIDRPLRLAGTMMSAAIRVLTRAAVIQLEEVAARSARPSAAIKGKARALDEPRALDERIGSTDPAVVGVQQEEAVSSDHLGPRPPSATASKTPLLKLTWVPTSPETHRERSTTSADTPNQHNDISKASAASSSSVEIPLASPSDTTSSGPVHATAAPLHELSTDREPVAGPSSSKTVYAELERAPVAERLADAAQSLDATPSSVEEPTIEPIATGTPVQEVEPAVVSGAGSSISPQDEEVRR